MLQLAKFVRFCFGLQSWLILAAPVLAVILVMKALHQPLSLQNGVSAERILFIFGYDAALGLVSLIGWWALRQGWPSAQVWALAASVVSLPHGRISLVAGVLGLAAFWKKDVVAATSTKPVPGAPPKHREGDGTHRFIDGVIPVLSLIWYIVASSLWAKWGDEHGLPTSVGTSGWINFWLAMFTSILFHELGHLLAGWGSAMTLRAIQIGPVGAQIRSGKWRFRFVPAGLLGGGAVGMVPNNLRHVRGRMVLLILGGPAASLLIGSIAALLTLTAPGSAWQGAWRFFALVGTFCLSDFIVNLTPLRPESQYSDGAQIYQIMRSGPWADRHLAMAMVGSSLVTPLRPRDFDEGVLQRAAESIRQGREGLHLGIFLAMHYFDSGKMQEGLLALREAVEQDPKATDTLEADSAAELLFYEAAIGEDAARAKQWAQRIEARGASEKQLDYWKGRSAMLCLEGQHEEARNALREADAYARRRPQTGAYDYDRWCLDVVRQKLATTDLARLDQATAGQPQVSTDVVAQ